MNSQKKPQPLQPINDFSKQFADQKNLQEDDIEIFPKLAQIIKFNKSS